jgi:hypothetical protein
MNIKIRFKFLPFTAARFVIDDTELLNTSGIFGDGDGDDSRLFPIGSDFFPQQHYLDPTPHPVTSPNEGFDDFISNPVFILNSSIGGCFTWEGSVLAGHD